MNRTENNIHKIPGVILPVLLCGLLYLPQSIAGVSGDSSWRVEKGDTVYSIARSMFPDDASLQARFRKELMKTNPEVFSQGANRMSIGTLLQMPGFAIAKPAAASKPVVAPPATAKIAPIEEHVTGRGTGPGRRNR